MTPKIKVRVSKARIDVGLKDPIMKKAKGFIIENKIRANSAIQKKK